jgi:hypothetical protein
MTIDVQGAGRPAPFLEVVTRCFKRVNMLMANMASLKAQTDPDWRQSFIIDDVGRGIGWAQEQLAEHAPALYGRYIWILDDDDVCAQTTLVAELKAIAAEHDPDVIMLRMDHGPLGVLPNGNWGHPPAQGHQGCSSYVVRREVFQRHADAWRSARYESDYDFIRAVWDGGPSVCWHDVVASRTQRISKGEPA